MVKYCHEVRDPLQRYDTVPGIKNDLMSTGEYADTGYVTFSDEEKSTSAI